MKIDSVAEHVIERLRGGEQMNAEAADVLEWQAQRVQRLAREIATLCEEFANEREMAKSYEAQLHHEVVQWKETYELATLTVNEARQEIAELRRQLAELKGGGGDRMTDTKPPTCPRCGPQYPMVKKSQIGLKGKRPDGWICSMNMPYSGCGYEMPLVEVKNLIEAKPKGGGE